MIDIKETEQYKKVIKEAEEMRSKMTLEDIKELGSKDFRAREVLGITGGVRKSKKRDQ